MGGNNSSVYDGAKELIYAVGGGRGTFGRLNRTVDRSGARARCISHAVGGGGT